MKMKRDKCMKEALELPEDFLRGFSIYKYF